MTIKMADADCSATYYERERDSLESAGEEERDAIIKEAKENGAYQKAQLAILKQRVDLTFIHENLDFYSYGRDCSPDARIRREKLGEAVVRAVEHSHWDDVDHIMRGVFRALIEHQKSEIESDFENEPKLIEEALNNE